MTAACGGTDGSSPDAGGAAADTGAMATTTTTAVAPSVTAPEQSPSTTGATPSSSVASGDQQLEPAPDFTLELGRGGTFTLAEEQRPVFIVFWAEW